MAEITRKVINQVKVVPLPGKKKKKRPILGEELFDILYAQVGIFAKKNSGKTCTVSQIVREKCDRDTDLIVFCGTTHCDEEWEKLIKWAKKNAHGVYVFQDIVEKKTIKGRSRKVDHLNGLLEDFRRCGIDPEAEQEQEEQDPGDEATFESALRRRRGGYAESDSGSDSDDDSDESGSSTEESDDEGGRYGRSSYKAPRQITEAKHTQASMIHKKDNRKKKFLAPDYIVVFDDISRDLKLPSVNDFMKEHRHHHTMTIFSTQYIKDLRPEAIKQMDYILLFAGLDPKHYKKVIDDATLPIDEDTFHTIYMDATAEPFHFLYIKTRHPVQFRKDFDQVYEIKK